MTFESRAKGPIRSQIGKGDLQSPGMCAQLFNRREEGKQPFSLEFVLPTEGGAFGHPDTGKEIHPPPSGAKGGPVQQTREGPLFLEGRAMVSHRRELWVFGGEVRIVAQMNEGIGKRASQLAAFGEKRGTWR